MAGDRPRRRLPPTSPLDALCMAYSDAPVGTFPDALGNALIDVLADLSARLEAQDALITGLGARVEELEERLAMAGSIFASDDDDEDDDGG